MLETAQIRAKKLMHIYWKEPFSYPSPGTPPEPSCARPPASLQQTALAPDFPVKHFHSSSVYGARRLLKLFVYSSFEVAGGEPMEYTKGLSHCA